MSAVTHLDAGTISGPPWVLPSVSPTGNQLLLLQLSDAPGMTVTGVVGNAQTWSLVPGAGGSNTSDWNGGNFREFVFEGVGSPSAGTKTLTIAGGDPYEIAYQILNVTGGDPASVVVQSNKATGTSAAPSVTLGTFAGGSNATVGWCVEGTGGANTITPGSGFTELNEYRRGAFTVDMATEWRSDPDTTVDATLTGGAKTWYMYGFELAEPPAGGDTTLEGSAQGIATVAAALGTSIGFAAQIVANATVTADLSTSIGLATVAQAIASTQSSLGTAIDFAAAAQADAVAMGSLATSIDLVAQIEARAIVAGAFDDISADLAAVANAMVAVSGNLGTFIDLAATAVPSAVVTADLSTVIGLSTVAQAVASVSADLTTSTSLAAQIDARATVAGELSSIATDLAAVSQSITTMIAELTTAIGLAAQLGANTVVAAELGSFADSGIPSTHNSVRMLSNHNRVTIGPNTNGARSMTSHNSVRFING